MTEPVWQLGRKRSCKTLKGACRERSLTRRLALAFRRGALGRAARAHIVERTSVYGLRQWVLVGFGATSPVTLRVPNYFKMQLQLYIERELSDLNKPGSVDM